MLKNKLINKKTHSYVIYALIVLSLLLTSLFVSQMLLVSSKASAACSTDTADLGTVTQTIDVKSAATYRAWVRIKAPNNTANSVFLEVDGTCFKMGDKAIQSGQWTWVDYRDGNTNNKANVDLTTGQKTVKIIGREQNVRVDKVIFTTYTECVPLKATDECAPPDDTTKPTVSITEPTNNANVSGTISVKASASDNEAVQKVEFLVDGAIVHRENTAPFDYQLDTTKLSEGNHSIVAKVTDTSGNFNSSVPVTITVANKNPDLSITAITWSPLSPKVNDEVTYKATVKNTGDAPILNATDVRVEFKVDGAVVSFSEQTINKLSAGQSLIFTSNSGPNSKSTWTATSGSHTVLATADSTNKIEENDETNNTLQVTSEVASLDTQAPTVSVTAPSGDSIVSGETTISADASDEGVSLLSRVEFYVDNKLVGTDTDLPYSYAWDTTEYGDKFYELRARAYDNAGNSANSGTVSVEVVNAPVSDDFEVPDNIPLPEEEQPPQQEEEPPVDVEDPEPIVVSLEDVAITTIDTDNNNVVDEFDLSNFFNEWGQQSETSLTVDFNSDGIVNVFDLSILLSNWSF